MSLSSEQPNLFATREVGELAEASALLALMDVPGIGPAKAIAAAKAVESWDELHEASDEQLRRIAGKVGPALRGAVRPEHRDELGDIRAVGYFDEEFPSLLRQIPQPPAVLWVRGTMPRDRCVAVVGTRDPTPIGVRRAARIASRAVAEGWGVVSGLALGIDTAAHEATLAEKGLTWAYLGSGVDCPTPETNRQLAAEIVASGGGLLSEVPPGSPVSPRALVARDRLQSGSSLATVIVQSGVPSGTLHTARFTLEQRRALLVVKPPSEEAGSPSWEANRALVAEEGCDVKMLSARGALAKRIALRRPMADWVIGSEVDLSECLKSLEVP